MDRSLTGTTRATVPITVVIAAYNAERFVGRALKMLTAQTVTASEIIVVDDGSTDGTALIAEMSSARVIRAPHAGLAATRNLGIAAASNNWIALLDVDDLWDPQKLEMQWAVHLANPAVILIATDYDEIDAIGSVLRECSIQNLKHYNSIAEQLSSSVSHLSPIRLARSLPEWGLFLPSTVLISKAFFEKIGGFNLEVMSEDSEFFLRCVTGGSAAMIEKSLVGYVRHASQITATSTTDHVSLDLCRHVMSRPHLYHPESVAAFRKRLPTLLLRHAFLAAREKNYSLSVSEVFYAVLSAAKPSVIATLLVRYAAKTRIMRSALRRYPGTSEYLSTIPGRKVTGKSTVATAQWKSLLADAEAGKTLSNNEPRPDKEQMTLNSSM